MSCKSFVPSKAYTYELSEGKVTVIDTKGAQCRIKALDGNVNVAVNPYATEQEIYILSSGETICFCGKLYLTGDNCRVCTIMYTTL